MLATSKNTSPRADSLKASPMLKMLKLHDQEPGPTLTWGEKYNMSSN